MAERILLVNPSKPPSKRRKATVKKGSTRKAIGAKTMAARKKPRTAAQKRATRKLVALNRARKSNPIRKRRASLPAVAKRRSNPVKRTTKTAATQAGRVLRYRRRNPISRKGIMDRMVFPAVTATSGALALDAVWAYLPLPVNVRTGPLRHAFKGLGAIALGWGASKVVKKTTADSMAMGALTVVLHNAAREALATFAPGVRMDGMGYYSAGYPVGPANNDMGLYVGGPGGMDTLNSQGEIPSDTGMGMYVGGEGGGYYM